MNFIATALLRARPLRLFENLLVPFTRDFHGLIPRTLLDTNKSLLSPTIPLISSACGFKVKGHLKRRCKDCYFVMRKQRLYVICQAHPRHKQMSIKPPEKHTWILTHATQSPSRPW